MLEFEDDALEETWSRLMLSTAHHKNKMVYVGAFAGLLILHLVELLEALRTPCWEIIRNSALRVLAKIALLCVVAKGVVSCWVHSDNHSHLRNFVSNKSPPSNSAAGREAWQHCAFHCSVLAFSFFYVPAQSFPPFAPWPCTVFEANCAEHISSSAGLAVRQADCSLQGQTALQLQILLILLSSWLVPSFEMLYFIWLWILGIHLGWTLAWRQTSGMHPYTVLDIAMRTLLLGASVLVAITRRFHRERGARLRFLQDLQQTETSKQIFRYLEYMMPAHVIGPMLKSPDVPIAEQVKRVSILFIMIADFDRLTCGMKPGRLLKFLNEQFLMIDQICAANGVAKIETVREEYVACVGVLPSDREEAERNGGHAVVLERMVRAAGQILELQTNTVKFKMGMHTGPIVAGVIGRKLPRFRLFGDTMNFAARHMQKAIVGQLQFGNETYKDLPVKLHCQVKKRGHVLMKGKGQVMAFTFQPEQRVSRTLPELPTFTAKPQQSDFLRSDFNTRFQNALEEVTVTEEAQAKRWILSEKEGFTPQMESSWLLWHNQQFITRSLSRWVGKWVILTLLVSAYDHSFVTNQAPTFSNSLYGSIRMSVFVYSRGAAVVLMLFLWYACDEWRDWVMRNPSMAHALMVAACCVVAMLLFLSSDALVFSSEPEYLEMSSALATDQAPQDHIFKLVFMLLFDSVTKALAPRFFHSLIFVGLASAIMLHYVVLPRSGAETMGFSSWFSWQGQLLFVASAVLNSVGSHQDEQDSRARYKSKCAVELTSARTEQLLDRLMPHTVVERLRSCGPGVQQMADDYRHATIAQSDLCGFTQLASERSPLEVVRFMGDLFGAFDELTDLHKVYKVDTVGDAYIAGMAEEPLTPTNSPVSVVNFALDMVLAVQDWAKDLGVPVTCRVGVHYGHCIGGIVGRSMRFKLGAESGYQLFGALMNGLEILESTAPEGRVQLSKACKDEVEKELESDKVQHMGEHLNFEERIEDNLTTSKGETHEYKEVGGKTFLVYRDKDSKDSHSSRRNTEVCLPSRGSVAVSSSSAPEADPCPKPATLEAACEPSVICAESRLRGKGPSLPGGRSSSMSGCSLNPSLHMAFGTTQSLSIGELAGVYSSSERISEDGESQVSTESEETASDAVADEVQGSLDKALVPQEAPAAATRRRQALLQEEAPAAARARLQAAMQQAAPSTAPELPETQAFLEEGVPAAARTQLVQAAIMQQAAQTQEPSDEIDEEAIQLLEKSMNQSSCSGSVFSEEGSEELAKVSRPGSRRVTVNQDRWKPSERLRFADLEDISRKTF